MTMRTIGAPASPPETAITECRGAVTATVCGLFNRLDGWRAAIVALEESTATRTSAVIDELVERLVVGPLSEPSATIIGAGFVAQPGFVSDAYWHLAWWLGEGNTLRVGTGDSVSATRRLDAETNPTSESFRDYTALEWWRVPERTGRRHVTGPYVDYLCTDDYTLTLTTPVYARGSLLGMVGVDIYVKRIESILMPWLLGIGALATIVNASGRVIASTDPHRAAGSILRIDGLGEYLHARSRDETEDAPAVTVRLPGGGTVHDCVGTTLALVVGH
jgi:hypothetical protein